VAKIVSRGEQSLDNYALVVSEVSKRFSKSETIPHGISFVVNKEECFGLLGTNGSGKTTLFRLLTGDLVLTSGNAYLGSSASLHRNNSRFHRLIGYCPQKDALLDRLTGMETLLFFGRIRGLESNSVKKLIEDIVCKFELRSVIDKRLSTYSGGNRRKISLAIALMGSPRVLLLDEPTTGVDAESRLKIWQFLTQLIESSKMCLLLSSHNMSECEALCSRLAIVGTDGRIKTIGFIDELKKRFAKGFHITVKVTQQTQNTHQHIDRDIDTDTDTDIERERDPLIDCFPDSVCLKTYHNRGLTHYHLVSDTIKLWQIFHTLERVKSEVKALEDYIVSNASLEQAFHQVLQSQTQPVGEAIVIP
jgi:ABC-type multidrug transport system ATPase subunit